MSDPDEPAERSRSGSDPRIALQGITPEELVERVPGLLIGEARRVVATVHRGGDFTAPHAGVRRRSRDAVRALGHVPALALGGRTQSSHDAFLKLACAFCATGRLGLGRNLETWEIAEQVRLVRGTLNAAQGERVHGVVFQGMGEPLANLDRVFRAVRVLTDPNALAIDARRITVSTAGLPSGIVRLARELRLAWSIGSALPPVRARRMPRMALARPSRSHATEHKE